MGVTNYELYNDIFFFSDHEWGCKSIDPTLKGIEARVSTLTLFIMCVEAFSNHLIHAKRHKKNF